MLATYFGDLDAVEALLDFGADPNICVEGRVFRNALEIAECSKFSSAFSPTYDAPEAGWYHQTTILKGREKIAALLRSRGAKDIPEEA